jgi:hypothetical protein
MTFTESHNLYSGFSEKSNFRLFLKFNFSLDQSLRTLHISAHNHILNKKGRYFLEQKQPKKDLFESESESQAYFSGKFPLK